MASGLDRPDLSALLRAQQAVLGALASSATPEEALAAALSAVTAALGWPAGAAWERTADGGLACTHGRGADPALAERAMAAAQPIWGSGGTVCVPLLARRGATGALELTDPGPDEPEPELVAALAALGLLIGRAVERSATETQLRRSDALLRATLNAAFDAVVAMDADGAIIAVNPAGETLFGYPAGELVGRELAAALIPPELREPHRRGLANYIAHGEERVLGHPLELTALRADGSEFPVEVAVRRLDVPGPPVFTGFIRDLTESRAAEARLRLFADEQAALRRVATLVAQDAEPAAVFAAVTEEVARLSGAETANMIRYQDDDTELVIGAWSEPGAANIPVGADAAARREHRGAADPPDRPPRARRRLRAGRGPAGRGAPGAIVHRVIGAPIVLDGHLWGALILRAAAPFPDGAEDRLLQFAELAAQALANAEAREQLAASRARLVRRATRSAAGWSATSTTAPSSGSSRWRCCCGCEPHAGDDPERPGASSRARRGARARAGGAARARPRPASGGPHRPRAGARAAVDLRPRPGARRRRDRAAAPAAEPARPPRTSSSPRR